ncbi:MAG: hypothetical protein M3Y23_07175, partial [Actinomycetota bacterium]|nr:hypothetical protein [Actinomycetota bacterium]
TQTYTWNVKTVQPVVAIDAGSVPESSSTVNSADFVLTTANGDAECSLDGSGWSACDSSSGQSYTDLADGNHTFEVRAVDEHGNVSATDAYSWLVVTAEPEVAFTSTPDENTRSSSATFGFGVTSADDDVVTECSLDGLEPFDCADPAAVVGLDDGAHSFTVTATDTAGIQGSDTYEWTVKAKIPGLAFDSVPVSISDSNSASFDFSSDEDPDVGYECRLDDADWAECASPVTQSSLAQGTHAFSIRATDSVGNVATETYDWTVDTVAPTIAFDSKPPATTQDVAELISFTASEAGTSLECSLDNAGFTACTSPALVKGLATGAHSFRVKATDAAGNEGPVATANWTIETAPVPQVQAQQSVQAATTSAVAVTGKTAGSPKTSKTPASKAGKAKTSKAKKKAKANKKAKAKAKKLKAKAKKRKAARKANAK